ncbi:unnamed protein product [Darwinula stevensoni]|uniref:Uncharacterized protein n=1 Tax=Darwinula stevensoni TaxID=69355 RepID=A0A7R8XBA9_9CRUS|nr:unnamed protein product [Darwinula stevensoni]CAG0887559.1 unnamed protein product [Darwinula stevensoni]
MRRLTGALGLNQMVDMPVALKDSKFPPRLPVLILEDCPSRRGQLDSIFWGQNWFGSFPVEEVKNPGMKRPHPCTVQGCVLDNLEMRVQELQKGMLRILFDGRIPFPPYPFSTLIHMLGHLDLHTLLLMSFVCFRIWSAYCIYRPLPTGLYLLCANSFILNCRTHHGVLNARFHIFHI